MKRLFRSVALGALALLFLSGLFTAYIFGGTSNAQTQADYVLIISDPTSGTLDVTITIQPGPTPFLDLYLREPVQGKRVRVTGLTVTREGRPVAHWQALPFYKEVVRLWNGFRTDPVSITYRIDPLWMKGPDSPRSYLGPEFAYIRGMVALYTPLSVYDILHLNFDSTRAEAGFANVEVHLPPGWTTVSPFGSEKIATTVASLRNSYFGFGPFAIQEIALGENPFLLGVYQGLPAERRDILSRQIPALFETMQSMTGFSPEPQTCYWSLAILPSEPIHGGASGTGSLVVEDDLKIIAHEMFHWWNGATLATSAEANWLKEGFTTYYAAKSLHASGLWTDEEFAEEIGKFKRKWSSEGEPRAMNLIEISGRFVRENNPEDFDPIYYGGALLAYRIDEQLQTQGASLDDIWAPLIEMQKPITPDDFLQALKEVGGEDLAMRVRAILNGHSALE